MKIMKRYKFGQAELNMKSEMIAALADAALSRDGFSRADLAADTGVSLVSAGKLLRALEICQFTESHPGKPENGIKAARLHRLSPILAVAVLTLEAAFCALDMVTPKGESLVYEEGIPDSSLPRPEAWSLFLSRASARLRDRGEWPAAVAIILPEAFERRREELQVRFDPLCKKHLGQVPLLYLTPCKALSAALRYALLPPAKQGLGYLIADRSLVGYACREHTVKPCRLGELLAEGTDTVNDRLSYAVTQESCGALLGRAVNAMDCFFSCDCYVIESRMLHAGSGVLRQLKLPFALAGKDIPDFFFCSRDTSFMTQGAAKATLAAFIKNSLHSSCKTI